MNSDFIPTHDEDCTGTIVAHLGVAVDVLLTTGERRRVRVKRRSGHVVGDQIVVRGEVLERLSRSTELRRRDPAGVHLVGANLDVLGVVVAPLPMPPAGFLDRAIVAARAAGLVPFIVINKADLGFAGEYAVAVRLIYGASARIFDLSAVTGDGLAELRSFFGEGHRGAFVGITGVGKSSLLNALCPDLDLRVGALNDHTSRGCHTTTVATLHRLDGGGELIDTPGFQEFGLVDIQAQDLAEHFPGFETTGEHACRFRNCRHRSEPGCAVVAMVERGAIATQRYDTYLELLDEVEANEEEERRRGWK